MTILLTGATGFVGGRLLTALEEAQRNVRCLTRDPSKLPGKDAIEGDVRDRDSLDQALAGCDAAYYLVHSLDSDGDFGDEEQQGARAFAAAARDAGVGRVVYLGGLAHGEDLSAHLESRRAVGEILRKTVPTLELRASVVIGEGSASYDLVRTLVESVPVLALPDWIGTETQPIAIDDVVAYLVEALDVPLTESRVYEIGGADRVTYRELIEEYAGVAGLQTPIVELPLPGFALGRLAELVPDRAAVWGKLIDGLRVPSAVEDTAALDDFSVRPIGLREALQRAAPAAAR